MSLLASDPGSRWHDDGELRVEGLGEADRGALMALIERDPVVNAVADVRIRASRSLDRDAFAGTLFGVRSGDGSLRAATLDVGNLIPVGGGAAEWAALAHRIGGRPRECSSIVGRRDAVTVMWQVLARTWGSARAVRDAQPLLVTDRAPTPRGGSGLRPITMADLDRYVPAARAMFTEELGIVPHGVPGGSDYRKRVARLIAAGRAFGVVEHGQVLFKADLGTVSGHTCQVQGVWVRPDLRGQGLATAAMAAVLQRALLLAPTVSLYVNDFNVPARRLYARLGMSQVATLSTVLF